mmetsp:Transcript_35578/g.83140  ORF Transcript_35578/g.83140 Transcript_35578/m.83140 type:complete len:593 (+) Transcript_35578:54-1832(+)
MGCASSTHVAGRVKSQPHPPQAVQKEEHQSIYDKYRIGRKLGAGTFAQVRIAVRRDTALADSEDTEFAEDEALAGCAVKIVDLRDKKSKDRSDALSKSAVERAKAESSIWRKVSQLNKPYFVNMHEVFWEDKYAFFIMERCDMTLLYDLETTAELTELKLGKVFQQMAMALAALSSLSVVHRDIKPDNFLVNVDGQVKLTDFGLSTVTRCDSHGVPSNGFATVVGTAPYMSPEMLNEGRYGFKTDVWSLGVTMYTLAYGAFPYSGDAKTAHAMKNAIREAHFLPSFRPWNGADKGVQPSPSLQTLIQRMISRDVEQRPTSSEVLLAPYWFELTSFKASAHSPSFRSILKGAKRAGAFTIPSHHSHAKDGALTDMSPRGRMGRQRSQQSAGSLESGRSSAATSTCLSQASAVAPRFRPQMGVSGESSMTSFTGSGSPTRHRLTTPHSRKTSFASPVSSAVMSATKTGGASTSTGEMMTPSTTTHSLSRQTSPAPTVIRFPTGSSGSVSNNMMAIGSSSNNNPNNLSNAPSFRYASGRSSRSSGALSGVQPGGNSGVLAVTPECVTDGPSESQDAGELSSSEASVNSTDSMAVV